MKQARQGDIYFEKIFKKDIKKGGGKVTNNPILAYGEVTGHSHRIDSKEFTTTEFEDCIVLELTNDGEVLHDEHDPIQLSSGIWKVTRQFEYDPLDEHRKRKVQD